MQTTYSKALENLYQTFSTYPHPVAIQGCPCCITAQDQQLLHARPLRELQNENLQEYTWSAITTWGTVTDFKYFLPRILELFTKGMLEVDEFIMKDKLDYAQWSQWPEQEQEAIHYFLKAWWLEELNYNKNLNFELLMALPLSESFIKQVVERWKLEKDSQGFYNYVALVEQYGQLNTLYPNDPALSILWEWAKTQAWRLEEGFFYYEQQNPAFAERLSNALYWLETIP